MMSDSKKISAISGVPHFLPVWDDNHVKERAVPNQRELGICYSRVSKKCQHFSFQKSRLDLVEPC